MEAYVSEIVSSVLGAFAGAAISVPITIRFCRNTATGSATQTNQSGATSGQDMVGRDKITGKES
ncbi:hypothetical protein [Thalassospira profundimaris]|uniref:hypothetical protein n=1 Tax=Thalassospira profundimaris TaxID=502049 RepID=UPI0015F0CE20|nr:hypothetical protein [Thalassospira profundimaris]